MKTLQDAIDAANAALANWDAGYAQTHDLLDSFRAIAAMTPEPPACGLTMEDVLGAVKEEYEYEPTGLGKAHISRVHTALKIAFAAKADSHVAVPREVVERAVRVTQEREEDRYTFGEDKHEITHDLAACLPKKDGA
jgi:hypothetical protein